MPSAESPARGARDGLDGGQRLDTKGVDVRPATQLGPVAQLQWVDVEVLVVDISYQRDADGRNSLRRIGKIAERFDWRKFAPVVVSPVIGGLYAIVDGQHRTRAAMVCGIGKVPCAIDQADAVGQAEAFEAINNQVTSVSSQQIFRARIAAGDAEALRIKALADEAGVVIMTSHKSATQARPEETMALGAITRAIAFHGEVTTRIALTRLRRASTDGHRALVASNTTALIDALSERPDLGRATDLEARSSRVDYARLRSESIRLAVVDPSQRQTLHLRDLMIRALAGPEVGEDSKLGPGRRTMSRRGRGVSLIRSSTSGPPSTGCAGSPASHHRV